MEDIGNAVDTNGDGDGREEGGRWRGVSDAERSKVRRNMWGGRVKYGDEVVCADGEKGWGVSDAWSLTSRGSEPEHYSSASFPLFAAPLLLQCRTKKVV